MKFSRRASSILLLTAAVWCAQTSSTRAEKSGAAAPPASASAVSPKQKSLPSASSSALTAQQRHRVAEIFDGLVKNEDSLDLKKVIDEQHPPPLMIQVLRLSDQNNRQDKAEFDLYVMGPQAMPLLIAGANNPCDRVGRACGGAMMRLGDKIGKPLMAAVRDGSLKPSAYPYLPLALSRCSQEYPDLVKLSRKGTVDQRALAFESMMKALEPRDPNLVDPKSPAGKMLYDAMVQGLADPEGRVRLNNIEKLLKIAKNFPQAVPIAIDAAGKESDPNIRVMAAQTLIARVPSLDEVAIRQTGMLLADMFKSDHDAHRREEIVNLSARVGRAPQVIPGILHPALHDSAANVHKAAIEVAGKLGVIAAPVVPDLIADLHAKGTRMAAIDSLAEIGPGAVSALPALSALASASTPQDTNLRKSLARAFQLIGGPEAQAALKSLKGRSS